MDCRELALGGVLMPLGRIDETCPEQMHNGVASIVREDRLSVFVDMSEADVINRSGRGWS